MTFHVTQSESKTSLHDQCRNFLKSEQGLPNLWICGPPGSGKTSLVHSMMQELYPDAADHHECVLIINASKDRGIDVIRTTVASFAMRAPPTRGIIRYRVLVLDEAEYLTRPAQEALRLLMEQHMSHTRFILIGNNPRGIFPALQSRCTSLWFPPLSDDLIRRHLQWISEKEQLDLSGQAMDNKNKYKDQNEVKVQKDKGQDQNTGKDHKYQNKGHNKGDHNAQNKGQPVEPDILNAIVNECDGDMRRAIDLLQDVAREAGKDTRMDLCHFESVTGRRAQDEAAGRVLRTAMGSGSAERMMEMSDQFLADGWSVFDFCRHTFQLLTQTQSSSNLNDEQKARIILALAITETHLLEGAEERLELYALQTRIAEQLHKSKKNT